MRCAVKNIPASGYRRKKAEKEEELVSEDW